MREREWRGPKERKKGKREERMQPMMPGTDEKRPYLRKRKENLIINAIIVFTKSENF